MKRIGLDVGCSYSKLSQFKDDHGIVYGKIPSIAVQNDDIGNMGGLTASRYRCGGQNWSVIPESPKAVNTQNAEYPYSSLNTVLMHHAIQQAGIKATEIEVATCIPLSHFIEDAAGYGKRKYDCVTAGISSRDGVELPTIKHAKILPECYAGWLDLMHDQHGQLKPGVPDNEMVLVDLGGRTIQTLIVRGMDYYTQSARSHEYGHLDMLKNINDQLSEKYSGVKRFSNEILRAAVASGRIEIDRDTTVDITAEIKEARQAYSETVLSYVSDITGSDMQVSGILYFGGGAASIADILSQREKSHVIKDGQYSSASGCLKYFKV